MGIAIKCFLFVTFSWYVLAYFFIFNFIFASGSLFVPNGVLPSVERAIGIYYGDQCVWSLTQSPIWCFLVSRLPFSVFKNISVVRKMVNFPLCFITCILLLL